MFEKHSFYGKVCKINHNYFSSICLKVSSYQKYQIPHSFSKFYYYRDLYYYVKMFYIGDNIIDLKNMIVPSFHISLILYVFFFGGGGILVC